jgi:hypothetical protein
MSSAAPSSFFLPTAAAVAPSFLSDAPAVQSLVMLDAEQPPLPGMDAAELALAQHGDFTGERFHDQRPTDYRRILELSAMGISTRRLASVFHVSQNTVRAVLCREGATVDAAKSRLRGLCFAGAIALAERIADDPDGFPKSSIPLALDVLVRNGQLLDGQATSITEHREGLTIDAFNAYVEGLRTAHEETGSAGKTAEHCAPAGAAGGSDQARTSSSRSAGIRDAPPPIECMTDNDL